MFKRVEKRIKKREEDRALDIDYEALGLTDTDSDDSEESNVFDQQEDESEEWGGLGDEDSDMGEDHESVEDDSVDEHGTSIEEDVDKKQVSFQAFTVDQALKEPIYGHPSKPNASLCALCPGKTLIGPLPISQHQESKAHARRSKRISELAALPENNGRDFSDLLNEIGGGKPQIETQGDSKRAEKKRKAVEIRKAKREKRKERDKAKREKQKQDADGKEVDDNRPTKPDHAALSDAKKQKDEKHEATSAEATPTTKSREDKKTKKSGGKIPQPSASNVNDQALQANKRKQKPETEKTKEQVLAEKIQAPPSKKRKTGTQKAASSSDKMDITRQIKDIAKSASKRAHQALDKANKGSGGGVFTAKPKAKRRKSQVK